MTDDSSITIDIDRFTYNPQTFTFVIERSELENKLIEFIHIKGKTRTISFNFNRLIKDREGEVLCELYTRAYLYKDSLGDDSPYQIKVIND